VAGLRIIKTTGIELKVPHLGKADDRWDITLCLSRYIGWGLRTGREIPKKFLGLLMCLNKNFAQQDRTGTP
jgi:hypothetical protein